MYSKSLLSALAVVLLVSFSSAAPSVDETRCINGYKYEATKQMPWAVAQDYCSSNGGSLAVHGMEDLSVRK